MKVKEGLSTIDVFLKKRYDLIPNLVETVKGYASHEKTTLNQVIEARNKAISAPIEDKSKYEGELSNALSKLLMLSEKLSQLKSRQPIFKFTRTIANYRIRNRKIKKIL